MQTTPAANTATETETLFLAAQAGEKYLRALNRVSEAKTNLAKLEREEYESVIRYESSHWADRQRELEDALHYALINLKGWESAFKSFAKELV